LKKSSKSYRARKPATKKQKTHLSAAPKAFRHDFEMPTPLAPEEVQQIVGAADLKRLSGYEREHWRFLGVAFFDLAIPAEDQRDDILIQKTEDGYDGDNVVDWVRLTSGDHTLVLAYFYTGDGGDTVELFANSDDAEAFFRGHPKIENVRLSYEEVLKEAAE
jgi:hypothetical protein